MSFIIAAPSSGCGKTTITLGLLRALSRRGFDVKGAKSGPDYIDPQFHQAACGTPCLNLDAWAMERAQILDLAARPGLTIVEGAMGLFDGAPPDGRGSTAQLARVLELPVVLVVDAGAMAQSVAALVMGFQTFDPDITLAGVILNRVGSPRHEAMLRAALAPLGLPVLGVVSRDETIARPSRHLGLVQAGEMPDLERFLNAAADVMEASLDLNALTALKKGTPAAPPTRTTHAPRTIALAHDAAFSFTYAHHLQRWDQTGVKIKRFSPLANDPVPDADEVILPGGYPELYAAQLAANTTFLKSLRAAADRTPIKGECGGYMVLGDVLTDATGTEHKMAGLLPLHTSFAQRKLHLGYRTLTHRLTGQTDIKAHEFHYASTLRADGTPLFDARDAQGTDLGPMGLIEGAVQGSFAHLIV